LFSLLATQELLTTTGDVQRIAAILETAQSQRVRSPSTALACPRKMAGRDGPSILPSGNNRSAEANMDSHIYRVIELVGTSEKGIDDAARMAIERAHKTIRNLRWFEIARTSGHIEDGKVQHFQVTLKVGFTMEDAR
jgi:flavin-binding protein dodecin